MIVSAFLNLKCINVVLKHYALSYLKSCCYSWAVMILIFENMFIYSYYFHHY